jgi:hypothetical protein
LYDDASAHRWYNPTWTVHYVLCWVCRIVEYTCSRVLLGTWPCGMWQQPATHLGRDPDFLTASFHCERLTLRLNLVVVVQVKSLSLGGSHRSLERGVFLPATRSLPPATRLIECGQCGRSRTCAHAATGCWAPSTSPATIMLIGHGSSRDLAACPCCLSKRPACCCRGGRSIVSDESNGSRFEYQKAGRP